MKPNPPKKNAGRKPNFTAKCIQGLSAAEQHDAIAWGDAALTRGGAMVRAYFYLRRMAEAEDDRQSAVDFLAQSERIERWIIDAFVANESQLFREIADCMDAKHRMDADGPTEKLYYKAFCFVQGCRDPSSRAVFFDQGQLRSVIAASKKCSFTPTVKEVHEFLCESMPPRLVPDYKTVERLAVILGIKPPPKPRGRKA